MGRSTVSRVQCDRCDRSEVREGEDEACGFTATMLGPPDTTVNFQDLCGPCAKTVRGLLEAIGKRIVGLSPDRKPRGPNKPKPATGTDAQLSIGDVPEGSVDAVGFATAHLSAESTTANAVAAQSAAEEGAKSADEGTPAAEVAADPAADEPPRAHRRRTR